MSLSSLRRAVDLACRLSDRHLRRYVALRQAVEELCEQSNATVTVGGHTINVGPGYVWTADLRAMLARLDAEHEAHR